MLDNLERALYWFASFVLETDADSQCQLRAPLDDETLVTQSDDLMSIIEIRGSRKLIGPPEFEEVCLNLSRTLSGIMKGGNGRQHSFAIGYRSSPATSARVLRDVLLPSLRTSRRFGIEDESYFEDLISVFASRTTEQSIYLVLYTHKTGLSPSDVKRATEWREQTAAKFVKSAPPGMGFDNVCSQSPRPPYPGLVPRHKAARDVLVGGLSADASKAGVGLLIDILEVGAALATIRRHMDAADFPITWRPRLIGDKGAALPSMAKRRGKGFDVFPARIGRQIVAEPLREIFSDAEIASRAGIYYASLVLTVPPEEGSMPFDRLAERIGRQIPWSVNMEIVPNGERLRKIDQTFASFLGAAGAHNKRVKAGWDDFKRLKGYKAGFRALFTTWAESEREVIENLSTLRSSLEWWGSANVSNETGAPGLASLCAAAGFSKRMPAPYLPVPADDLARMLPLLPPASPWETGQLITHTNEGRLYPVAFGTSLQGFWGTAIFAPTSAGKSYLLNMINFGVLNSAGLDDLPYMTIVDVGPSSKLVMDLYRALLQKKRPDLARQVVSLRIRNTPEYTVNLLDTQHGCDMPTIIDKDAVISMLATLCPTIGLEGEQFLAEVVDEAYRMFSRSSPEQRRWQANALDPEGIIDRALREIGFQPTEKTRVWEVVDALMDAGRVDDSARAQRYAMPKLENLIKASKASEIMTNWRTARSSTGELLTTVFERNITTALTQYALISGYTRFELTNARAISIDLEEVVTGTSSEEGKKRAALMFLFGRRLGARNYFLRWDELKDIVPERYRVYQQNRIARLESSYKYLEYDEIHYASGIPAMHRRIQEDCRVGRKYKCVTVMASQLLEDFPKAAIENCFTFLILGVGTDNKLEEIQKTFGLSESEANAIKDECIRPGRVFGMFRTKRGTTSQILNTTGGGFMTWAFTTVKEDDMLRTKMKEAMGGDYLEALHVLHDAYPSGSADKQMDSYRRQRNEDVSEESIVEVFTRKALERAAKIAEENDYA